MYLKLLFCVQQCSLPAVPYLRAQGKTHSLAVDSWLETSGGFRNHRYPSSRPPWNSKATSLARQELWADHSQARCAELSAAREGWSIQPRGVPEPRALRAQQVTTWESWVWEDEEGKWEIKPPSQSPVPEAERPNRGKQAAYQLFSTSCLLFLF